YYRIGYDVTTNAEMLFVALVGSGKNNLRTFTTENYQNGAIQMTLRNHKGSTIRTVFKSIRHYAEEHPLKNAHYQLAGGMIAVLAAVNDVILSGELQSIALALLLLFILCAIAYKSLLAGLFFLPTVVLSNTITFAYMSLNGIGLDVNTMPVAALGIGLGIDYSFYVADRIQEYYDDTRELVDSIGFGLMTAGRGVVVTALTMIIPVACWYFLSSVKFQAEMGLLIALWMTISATSALLVIPSLIYLFRPKFLIRGKVGHGGHVAAVSSKAVAG
ncbi:MAG: efflux RND transporter permease subunit, partial [Sinobacteraceae bacterium]|nr:efflux RND transporter permease subunit [Nevskiaceae bacterium]